MKLIFSLCLMLPFLFSGCQAQSIRQDPWKEKLTSEEYNVLREKGTEPAFSGKYYQHKEKGIYHCKACGQPLFTSESKYNSGTGWPSFYEGLMGKLDEVSDNSHGWVRTEIICSKCKSHLGHVFNDGPQPTGLRYCVNSICLDFKKE